MITLVAIFCHIAIVPLCTDEVITTSDFTALAGKVDDPIEMQFSIEICKLKAPQIISSWMQERPDYRDGGYYVKDIKCVPGKYEPSHRA